MVGGCPACKKRLNSTAQFLDHLANDAMPALLDRLAVQSSRTPRASDLHAAQEKVSERTT